MLRRILLLVIAPFALFGCATPPTDPEERAEWEQVNDPLEPMNRGVFEFNTALDRAVIKPIALAYRDTLPEPVRRSVGNFLSNLNAPLIFASDVLQGEAERAGTTLMRAAINTTIGVGGLFDMAADWNLVRHDEDFGQTLAVWGASDGPYVMLPLFGPTNPRDTVGLVVEFVADPLGLYLASINMAYLGVVRSAMQAVDTRTEYLDSLDAIERTSLDFYSTIRSVSRQFRQDQIRNNAPIGVGYGAAAASNPR